MSVPETIRGMRAAGVSDRQIIDTVLAMEEERLAKGRARTAKHRNNNRNGDVTHVTDVTSPDKEKSPTPPKEINPLPPSPPKGGSSPTNRATRISPDWQPSAENITAAVAEGFTETEAHREGAKFRDYWLAKAGKDGAKLDWSATWRNWVRRSAEQLGKSPQAVSGDVPGKVFILKGSEQWEAWRRYRNKPSLPSTERRTDDGRTMTGWYFPTELPPARCGTEHRSG